MPSIRCDNIENIHWGKLNNDDFALSSNVDIWRLRISSNIVLIDRFGKILSTDEHTRASRYHHQKDTERFLVSRIALRFLVAKYSKIDPGNIEFAVGSNKKPFLRNAGAHDLHYNVSHSGDWILIAFSDAEIGTDIEMIDDVFSYGEILKQNFSGQEISFITEAKNQSENFYLLWTRKEALLKATSKGVDSDLPFVPSLEGSHEVEHGMIGSGKDFFVSSFRIAENYIGSIAYAAGNHRIRFRDLNDFLFSH